MESLKMVDTETAKSGFIAIVGAPNVGKSTLLNKFVGSKVSIVSPKVQTTRSRVLGICIEGNTQIIFIDTPGIFAPRRRLDRAMVAAAWGGAGDADEVLFLVDASRGICRDTSDILDKLEETDRTVYLALNKVDLVRKENLLLLIDELTKRATFADIFMISAETGDGTEELLSFLAETMPDSPWLFPEDQISDMPQRMLAAEITREKIFLMLRQELPYATTVETEKWEEKKDGSVKIDQTIYVERPTQKAIVLGKNGAQIKSIGESARRELEKLLNVRIHLFLFVKVREKWGDDPERYRDWGLDYNA
jgi:GTP-binding protein Era